MWLPSEKVQGPTSETAAATFLVANRCHMGSDLADPSGRAGSASYWSLPTTFLPTIFDAANAVYTPSDSPIDPPANSSVRGISRARE